ncbi:hypothetical protein CSA80_00070 [Candidatus Saccharibacteria bacterium]|nr:MAG: hypothetical protein CSA80_00070 [Candidatus Saccharibacteria bacterium]
MSDEESKIVVNAGKPKLKSPKTPVSKASKAKKNSKRAAGSAPVAANSQSPKLSTVKGTTAKETLYVDVDDEITAIIERVTAAKGGIIALVLPKRATVLQSIVNMRLLKRAADASKKHLVLVTSETSLLPLAGLVGLHVAETPSSKPTIPPRPDLPSDEPESVDETLSASDASAGSGADFDPGAAAETPIGELAGTSLAPAETTEEVVLDDTVDAPAAAADVKPNVTPVKKNKKLAVPNFNKFRLRLTLALFGVMLLVAGWIVATKVLPKAAVAIKTNSQVIKSNLDLTLDVNTPELDEENAIVPAVAESQQKTLAEQVPATGQKNKGEKADGTVKFTITKCAPDVGVPSDIPTGSSVTGDGKTFITQERGDYSFSSASGSCVKYVTNNVDIVALKAGTDYNLSAGTNMSGPAGVKGVGSTSGGTDNIVKVVAQADIDAAKAKIAAKDATAVKDQLKAALQGKGLLPVPSTFVAGEQKITTSVEVNEEADAVTVTSVVPYTMLGINEASLKTLVLARVNEQIDTKKQKILDDGLAKAVFSQQNPGSATSAVVSVRIESVAGPELDVETLKRQVAGKKAGEIKQAFGELPGVTNVEVSYGPFWVTSAPKDTGKITITIAKPTIAK